MLTFSRTILNRTIHFVYLIPYVGIWFRKFVESRLGRRAFQDRNYWNESLKGWASSYLGGTFANDLRDSVTVLLAKRLAPNATSMLDLGCAGATLAQCIGPEFKVYWGVDISDVAIAKAQEQLAKTKPNSTTQYNLVVSTLQDFKPSRQFDIIVFNEVLYYIPLNQLPIVTKHCIECLSPNGLILISLKDQELCRPIQSVLLNELKFEHSVLYQQQPITHSWKTIRNSERPAYVVQAFRPRQHPSHI